jgi:outer membrane protein
LEAASAAVASSIKRYDLGAADILELLTTQTTLADAVQERIRCISEFRSAKLRLLANAGILGKLDGKNEL